jgi:DNA-binding MarR family transcriptional regulator
MEMFTAELAEIVQQFLFLKPRLKFVVPEKMTVLMDHLAETLPDGKPGNLDYDLFYSVGVILSRENEPVRMSELSKALDVPLSTATRIVDWLVKNDYAHRLPDPDDRRIVRISLTESGQEVYGMLKDFIAERIQQVLVRFSPDERVDLMRLMRKLLVSLESEV